MTIFTNTNLLTFLFFCTFTTFFLHSVSCFAVHEKISYADHCASFVPESTLKADHIYFPHEDYHHTGYYYTGGDNSNGGLSRNLSYDQYGLGNKVEFRVWSIEETDVLGLFKLQAHIQFPKSRSYYYFGNSTTRRKADTRRFKLHGFWSESSGKLCMVGYGRYTNQGTSLDQPAILKLYNLINSTTITSLISGTIESILPKSSDVIKDQRYFEPISLLILPNMNYKYTISTDDISFRDTDDHVPSSSLKLETLCEQFSFGRYNEFDLKYSSKCVSARNCTPIAALDYLPQLMSVKSIACSESDRTLRVLLEFLMFSHRWYSKPFSTNTTLVAEGSWDAKKNQLQFVACHFLNDGRNTFNNSHVGDCSTRLSLRFPAKWTIGNISSVVGHIWSIKSKTEAGNFPKIAFKTQQLESVRGLVPGAKYEYTKLERVHKLCPSKKSAANKHISYPSPISYDMRFDMSARSSKGLDAWGYAEPVSVGNKLYDELRSSTQYETVDATSEDDTPITVSAVVMTSSYKYSIPTNISYKISIQMYEGSFRNSTNFTMQRSTEMQIFAEGVYDTEGNLCMVGCRDVGSNNKATKDSVDCEILINIHFPPENQHRATAGHIKATIESMRGKSDPLHFERLEMSSAAGYKREAGWSIWRMHKEIIMMLASTTLAIVFVTLQQLHVRKHPDVLPSVSILMLLTLCLGYMMTIMLNFDAAFAHNNSEKDVFLKIGGSLAFHEGFIRVMTMVAFLLNLRLLQQTWSARSANETQKKLWDAEKKAFPLLVFGLSCVLINLNSYAGLVLDGFLLPQILLNSVCNSKQKALSFPFYIGTTLVRVLPHAYDLYRSHSSHQHIDESYIYAGPVADFYSTSWNIIIPIGCLLFSLLIFLQQKFGGRCFLPQKLREQVSYEEVPRVGEDELPK